YRGTARLTAEHREPQVIEIALEVQPFTIPPTSSLPNSFGLSLLSVARGHHLAADSAEAEALLGQYARALLAHRVSGHGMSMRPARVSFPGGEPIVDFSAYDREMAGFFEGRELPSGARFTTAEVRESSAALTDAQKSAYYAQIERHFRQKNWPVLLFY